MASYKQILWGFISSWLLAGFTFAGEPVVVELTQVPCQFLETESKDHGFNAGTAKACEGVNEKTGETRLRQAKAIKLKSGSYIFRVTNKNVPYELGFYLRAANLTDRWSLPKVSGGGIHPGTTKDYAIDLKSGQYVFSCPLNPTLDYSLVVE